ncbi:unnamed protein product [Didymodactylos carnosus]|uniref:Uncharacterized protein n=1 Tax=Didymodactylos carnosus TaxID=1234261 RepID=A0A815GHA1_9BILA|nr:unnamed protein product [Didymodactylos carnosus]CAF1469794.1 unnamed protein product [Didymodactylos carnosus]CAF4199671.1 unnamed protein product [Didymodactylos carnosus]CAF4261911.1 unnamed protein product [Didymodactylos carnosus]
MTPSLKELNVDLNSIPYCDKDNNSDVVKLRSILQQKYLKTIPIITNNPESRIIDPTTRKLSQWERSVLELRLNFIPTTDINTAKYVTRVIAGAESGLYKKDSIQKEHIEGKNVKKEQEKVLKNPVVDDSILVVPSDKGGKIVAVNTSDDKAKIEEMLSNSSTYTKLSRESTKRLIKELTDLVKVVQGLPGLLLTIPLFEVNIYVFSGKVSKYPE